MNMQGIVLWALRSIGDVIQFSYPFLMLLIAVIWFRSKERSMCFLALVGAVIAVTGRVTQWMLPSVSWTLVSNIEHAPSGGTTVLEAIVYLAFPNLGQGIFLAAVLVFFLKKL